MSLFFADNSDLLAVTVVYRDGARQRRFLVVGVYQIVLVEPDATRLGWGVARFVGCLQDLEVRDSLGLVYFFPAFLCIMKGFTPGTNFLKL